MTCDVMANNLFSWSGLCTTSWNVSNDRGDVNTPHQSSKDKKHEKNANLLVPAMCAWALTQYGLCLDHSGFWLSDEEADNAVDYGLFFAQSYMWLSTEALKNARPRYRIRPKLHSFVCELLQRMSTGSRLNPRIVSCSGDEDLIGKICGVIKSKIHPSTLAKRVLERYMLGLNVFVMSQKEIWLRRGQEYHPRPLNLDLVIQRKIFEWKSITLFIKISMHIFLHGSWDDRTCDICCSVWWRCNDLDLELEGKNKHSVFFGESNHQQAAEHFLSFSLFSLAQYCLSNFNLWLLYFKL